MKHKLIFSTALLFGLVFTSCVKTPEQQYREKMEKTTDEELLLAEVFKKPRIYKLAFKDKLTDDIKGYQFNDGIYSDIGSGATVQVMFVDESTLQIDGNRFVGSYSNGYYSSENGRYQVTIVTDEEYKTNPNIVKRYYSINGVKHNLHRDNAGVSRHLSGVRLHPGLKSNVILVRDTKGFINGYNPQLYKTYTVAFENLTPIGYYEGPLDKR